MQKALSGDWAFCFWAMEGAAEMKMPARAGICVLAERGALNAACKAASVMAPHCGAQRYPTITWPRCSQGGRSVVRAGRRYLPQQRASDIPPQKRFVAYAS